MELTTNQRDDAMRFLSKILIIIGTMFFCTNPVLAYAKSVSSMSNELSQNTEGNTNIWLNDDGLPFTFQEIFEMPIDELQFFDSNIVKVIEKLMNDGKRVIGTGLELDFKAEPFGSMPQLLCIATDVTKLHAVCMKCGCFEATRTQRLIDGKPADKNSPLIMIGGDETYEARCIKCYELPDAEAEKRREKEKNGLKLIKI